MESHYGPKKLPWGIESAGYWARHPNNRLVVFVHGFMGGALSTWNDFATLLPQCPKGRGADLVFFGYDGVRKSATNSAGKLAEMLDALANKPGDSINRTLPASLQRSSVFRYKKIVLVAHSLGALVTRRALIDAKDNGSNWPDRTVMALFAPAHLGADVIALAAEAVTTIPYVGAAIAPLVKWRWKVLRDLSENSPAIKTLVDHTNERIDLYGNTGWLVAKKVYFGDKENIVVESRFVKDPPHHPHVAGHGHRSICKPQSNFPFPVEEVEALL